MDVLDSARKRKSAFAAQLADQDAAMAQLQAKLEAARVEGERLKARAEEAPEAPAAVAHADGTSVAVVVSVLNEMGHIRECIFHSIGAANVV